MVETEGRDRFNGCGKDQDQDRQTAAVTPPPFQFSVEPDSSEPATTSPYSVPTRSLADENEFLRAELRVMRAELARFEAMTSSSRHHPQKHEGGRRLSAPTTPSSPATLSGLQISSTAHAIAISPKVALTRKEKVFRKWNRHPSDDEISDTALAQSPSSDAGALPFCMSADSLDSEVMAQQDVDKHESGRGLKLRKQAQSPKPKTYHASSVLRKMEESASLMIDTNSASSLQYEEDIEMASFLPKSTAQNSAKNKITPVATFASVDSSSDGTTSPDALVLDNNDDGDANSMSFSKNIQDRAGWLVGLLVLQSMSSFIIARNEDLLQSHLVIVRFLTMLVGAGGNAGNQASVGVIRGLATGAVHDGNVKDTLWKELKMGLALSFLLGFAGAIRAAVFATPLTETLAITCSLFAIVFISVLLGAVLPLAMKFCRIDPAHASTSIQVLMDIIGVTITVFVSGVILDSEFNAWVIGLLGN